jgi:diguanylate cyclase (GGDEF)-like protein
MPDLALLATALTAFSVGIVGGALWSTHRNRRELARMRLELERAEIDARTDSLTGIGNRKAFDERLKLLGAIHERHGTPFSVVLIDVDQLKAVNDRDGHAAGDDLLRRLAALLVRSVRESDFVGRIGGDEFALLLPQTPPEGAQAVMTRILTETGRSTPLSAGIAGSLADESAVDLLRRADSALYTAKRAGGIALA